MASSLNYIFLMLYLSPQCLYQPLGVGHWLLFSVRERQHEDELVHPPSPVLFMFASRSIMYQAYLTKFSLCFVRSVMGNRWQVNCDCELNFESEQWQCQEFLVMVMDRACCRWSLRVKGLMKSVCSMWRTRTFEIISGTSCSEVLVFLVYCDSISNHKCEPVNCFRAKHHGWVDR